MRQLVDLLADRRPTDGPYLIGITGGVAVGKSTLSAVLSTELTSALGEPSTWFGTDGFLWPNHVLEQRGITMEKGFPVSYDVDTLRAALLNLRAGREAAMPSYSHRTYDIEIDRVMRVGAMPIIIVEGLHLTRFAADLLHVTVHLDAPETVVEEWYLDRFNAFVAAAEDDPESFYQLFVGIDPVTREAIARQLWSDINLVNLRQHIEPWRDRADLVVRFDADHHIVAIDEPSS